jgi:hypothetical protein
MTLADNYTAEFDEMVAGAFHEAKTDNTAHLLDYDGTRLESYFSPTDLVAFEVWRELEQADETIHFATFLWTDDLLTERVMERLDAGVEVTGVWDQLGAADVASAYEALREAGAKIRLEDLTGKLHHKFALIDVAGSDPVVIVGSGDWTDAGAYDNDENTLIIHDGDLARVYYDEWQRLWLASGPAVGFSSSAYSVTEGDGNAYITVNLDALPDVTISADYTTSEGTAKAGTDYIAASGTLTFDLCVASQAIVVPIIDDTDIEANETLTLSLSFPPNSTLGFFRSAVLTILDDDGQLYVFLPVIVRDHR